MGYRSYLISFLGFYFSLCHSLSNGFTLPLKAVNLGNWLVVEGWMEPSLFDGIINKDLLDGTQVQFKSTKFQRYLTAENGGGDTVVASHNSAHRWETFKLWRVSNSSFNFRVHNKQFLGLANQGGGNNQLVAASNQLPGQSETFEMIRNQGDPTKVRIRASNSLFLQVKSESMVSADYEYEGSSWEDSDPSVFHMTIVPGKALQGEYQITNGYGPDRAPQVMQDHWNTYITEDDFKFMSENGITAVRIPVGWWIADDPTPPKPFVGGSLAALDNAFTWAEKLGMGVIVDLHALPGSQNGQPHSGTRDGHIEWGDSFVPDTVKVIDFLANRYSNSSSLAAIEVMNEPKGVDLDTLKKYYQEAYDAVRKHTESAYVIFSNPLDEDSKVLLSFARSLDRVVLDVHYYNLYTDSFKNMNAQQNIDYIRKKRASDLQGVTTMNGPLSFVGEWTAEWNLKNALKEERQRFAQAQIEVYTGATFGWAYWAYKCSSDYWSLKVMIENGYIKL
ncbi:hypothetical protein L6164_025973 [Bauhinia variegata]|uniref:Uncharacterized protein n=1 Tax=Bauhinia variegata TaxID=167791 RepID=A0ACB9M5Z2_BAUVA|nr:hypothetical protein L6164_025973 [Bauhinia variegata]